MKKLFRWLAAFLIAVISLCEIPALAAEGEELIMPENLLLPTGEEAGAILMPDGTVFDPVIYAACNQDVARVVGTSRLALYTHYLTYGRMEGRACRTDYVPENDVIDFQLLSCVTTAYKTNIPRATNVQLASERINCKVLLPGEEFSYSNSILPRTRENGYVEAGIILNHEPAVGIGGGICQVSSTLYAALLDAGIPATERHPHSRPVSYIGAGRDATIAAGAMDLRFVNVLDHPLFIQSFYSGGKISVMMIELKVRGEEELLL